MVYSEQLERGKGHANLVQRKGGRRTSGVGTTTVNRWVKLGEFPNTYKLNPRAKNSPFRIPEEDIVAFEEERQQYLTQAAE